jgi:ATP-dependent DNA helicase RecG
MTEQDIQRTIEKGEGIDVESFQPFPKNPHLAQIFTQMGRSEELGTGLRNVYKFTKAYSGSDQVVFFEEDIFSVTVPLKNFTENVSEKVGEKLTENQSLILKSIIDNPYITANELVLIVKISKRKIEENIAKLRQKGFIQRIGLDRGGCWEVSKN